MPLAAEYFSDAVLLINRWRERANVGSHSLLLVHPPDIHDLQWLPLGTKVSRSSKNCIDALVAVYILEGRRWVAHVVME